MSRRVYTERDIHMALDGELPADELPGYEAWLDANPDMKARSVRFEADRARLRQTFADALTEPVPERLERMVIGEPVGSSAGGGTWRMAAAAVLLLSLGVSAGYLAGIAGRHGEPAEEVLAGEAIAAHTIFAAEKRHAVEVGGDDREHLLGWLSNRIGLTLVAPDLADDGFELVGGRLLPAGNNRAALLLYEDAEGNRISVFVMAEKAGTAKGTYKLASDGPSAIYWLDEGYACAIVGNLPQERLSKVAGSAYRQLLAGAGKV